MSDRPRIGSTSGRERAETFVGASGLPAAPRMLMNSVSGEVMWGAVCYEVPARRNQRRI